MNVVRHEDVCPERELMLHSGGVYCLGEPDSNSVAREEMVSVIAGECEEMGVAWVVVEAAVHAAIISRERWIWQSSCEMIRELCEP